MQRTTLAALVLLASVPSLPAQSVIASGPYVVFGAQAHANLVQDAVGRLFTVSIEEQPNTDRAVVLTVSFDGGITWQQISGAINDANSGLSQPYATNQCAMAIDDRGVLHITWASHYYPSNYAHYYASYDPIAGTRSSIVDIRSAAGASTANRNAAMAIEVDGSNTVWLVAASGSSWREQLLQSTAPYAAGGTFSSVGAISPTASAQTSRIAVDNQGRVHCSYYRNVSPGNYEHRFYEPGVGWGTETTLGNTIAPNDYYGLLCADALGNVHSVYAKDSTGSSTWDFAYRRWDVGTGWSAETPIFQLAPAQYTGISNYRIIAVGCNEASGRVHLMYRDLNGDGRLSVMAKDLAATSFAHVADLRPGTLNTNHYTEMNVRGTLFPAFNNSGNNLDMAWREGVSPFELRFQRLPECPGSSIVRLGEGCSDGSGAPLVSLFSGTPCLQGVFAVGVQGSAPAWLVIGLSDQQWNGLQLPLDLGLFGGGTGCAIRCSQEVVVGPFAPGTLVSLQVPNFTPLSGRTAWFQSLLIDGSIGTRLPVATSDALCVTFGS